MVLNGFFKISSGFNLEKQPGFFSGWVFHVNLDPIGYRYFVDGYGI